MVYNLGMERRLRIAVLVIGAVLLALLGYEIFQVPAPLRDGLWTGFMFIPTILWGVFMEMDIIWKVIIVLTILLLVVVRVYDEFYPRSK